MRICGDERATIMGKNRDVPSGNLTVRGKSASLIGKSTISMGNFP
jgi:hypothetical protein